VIKSAAGMRADWAGDIDEMRAAARTPRQAHRVVLRAAGGDQRLCGGHRATRFVRVSTGLDGAAQLKPGIFPVPSWELVDELDPCAGFCREPRDLT